MAKRDLGTIKIVAALLVVTAFMLAATVVIADDKGPVYCPVGGAPDREDCVAEPDRVSGVEYLKCHLRHDGETDSREVFGSHFIECEGANGKASTSARGILNDVVLGIPTALEHDKVTIRQFDEEHTEATYSTGIRNDRQWAMLVAAYQDGMVVELEVRNDRIENVVRIVKQASNSQ